MYETGVANMLIKAKGVAFPAILEEMPIRKEIFLLSDDEHVAKSD